VERRYLGGVLLFQSIFEHFAFEVSDFPCTVAWTMSEGEQQQRGVFRRDLAVLTKVRLNTFVLVTTFFGYYLGSRTYGWNGMTLLNTLVGTAAAAFGSAAFNQLMEIDQDARMKRTADRPLPSKRMGVVFAFLTGVVLCTFGLTHLSVKVANLPAVLALTTVVAYVFIYTPMKRKHSVNTLLGAIPGAIPPVIGWTAAGGGIDAVAWFLFALLFFWQLPHFIAINWMCREEYEDAGYQMWSNGDLSGRKSGRLALIFSLSLALLSFWPCLLGRASYEWGVVGFLLGSWMGLLAYRFMQRGDRVHARKLFLFTLLYLPLALTMLALFWKKY
jgi:protoheme IX farnesyltransferase